MFQKSALPGSPHFPTLLYSLPALQKSDLGLFSVPFVFVRLFLLSVSILNVYICLILAVWCLFFFPKAEFTPPAWQQNVKSTWTHHAWRTQTGGPRPWLYTDISYQHREQWNPPSVLYQRIYYSHRKNSDRCVKPSGGGAVDPRDCYNGITLCLLWYLTKCDWLRQAFQKEVLGSVLFRIQGSCIL